MTHRQRPPPKLHLVAIMLFKATLESIDLPFGERVSIAHHICQPERVEPFIGPIFCRLCRLTEALKGALLAIDNFSDSEVCKNKELNRRTVKIGAAVEDIAAEIQDELLLDDVLMVCANINHQALFANKHLSSAPCVYRFVSPESSR